ncbi:hypothetical protein O181_010541 [Austropuccinia psidii MF-1]|uniref:Uncharacterized protein n=1 Tax=Austropuccinia psidii MF-1 TaxID=1389203 RepID=A0A9Q3BTZ7_9BASI|nr:hypothetical protein [Austropuccinia psidii MF-1]
MAWNSSLAISMASNPKQGPEVNPAPLALWPISNLINPQDNTPHFGPGGPPALQGPLAPLETSRVCCPPRSARGLGPKWHFWAFEAPTTSTVCGKWAVGCIRPLLA